MHSQSIQSADQIQPQSQTPPTSKPANSTKFIPETIGTHHQQVAINLMSGSPPTKYLKAYVVSQHMS